MIRRRSQHYDEFDKLSYETNPRFLHPSHFRIENSNFRIEGSIEELIELKDRATLTQCLRYQYIELLETYPWLTSLSDDGITESEAVELLLSSEHLEWLAWDEAPDTQFDLLDQSSDAHHYLESPLSHQQRCAHWMCQTTVQVSQHLVARERSVGSPSFLSNFSQGLGPNDSGVFNLERSTDDGEESQFRSWEAWESCVLAICGLGGIFHPDGVGPVQTFAQAEFKRARCTIFYDDDWASISSAAEYLLRAFKSLNERGGICDKLSIFIKVDPVTVQLVTFSFSELQQLHQALLSIAQSGGQKHREHLHTILKGISTKFRGLEMWYRIAAHNSKAAQCSALLLQMLSVGMLTYTRGHSKAVNHPLLSRSIEEFDLSGCLNFSSSILAQRVRLRCLDEMLHRKIWMFSFNSGQAENASSGVRYTVASELVDVFDLWGGKITVEKNSFEAGFKVKIGQGYLSLSGLADRRHDFDNCKWQLPVQLHYANEQPPGWLEFSLLKPGIMVGIGATLVNDECSISAKHCREYFSCTSNIFSLGTRRPSWKTTGRSAVLQVGAKVMVLELGMSQTRDIGMTKKAYMIDHKSLNVLNSPWGLEVSVCTGFARRVPLRALLYGEVLRYLALELDQHSWDTVSHIVTTLSSCTSERFYDIIQGLSSIERTELQKATELLLLAMEHTGSRYGKDLVLWWPEAGLEPRGLRFGKEKFVRQKPWLPIIQDSEHCATFGLLTTRCLQHSDVRSCRTPAEVRFTPFQDLVFETAVCMISDAPSVSTGSSNFAIGQHLVWWKERDALRNVMKVVKSSTSSPVSLAQLIYSGRMPLAALKALKRRYLVVRELQAHCDPSVAVLIAQDEKGVMVPYASSTPMGAQSA